MAKKTNRNILIRKRMSNADLKRAGTLLPKNTNKRMSNADLKRAGTLLPKKSPSEMADSITNYYKELLK
jgi:hypothetical protein